MEADDCCPLCMEDMDVTDKNFRPCKCGYQICLFCYRHIKDDLNGLCPACRTPYDEANVTFVTPDPQEMAKLAKEKKAKELKDKKEQQAKEKRDAELKARQEAQARAAASVAAAVNSVAPQSASASTGVPVVGRPASCSAGSVSGTSVASVPARQAASQLAGKAAPPAPPMRVIQRTLVYVMGLSPRIAKEDILRRHEYFGQYGKILRIQVNGAHLHSSASGPPSCSCYITYSNREEAEQAILAVDNVVLDGRALKASFGTTKSPHAIAQGGTGAQSEGPSMHDLPAEREDPPVRVEPTRHGAADPGRGVGAIRPGSVPLERHHESDEAANHTASVPEPISRHSEPPPPVAPPAIAPPAVAPPASVTSLREADVSKRDARVDSRGSSFMGPAVFGATGLAMDAANGSCPTGSEMEPWTMLGNIDDLFSGIVADEQDEEEFPCNSRFARFFTKSEPKQEVSPLSSLAGVKLDEPEEDWQQGLRALLPNVNIKFSTFGDGANVPPGSLDTPAPASSSLVLDGVGIGSLAGFGAFSSQQSKFPANGLHPFADSAAPGTGSLGGHAFGSLRGTEQLGSFSPPLGSAALNGNCLATGCAGTEVSLLGQLTSAAPLPGAQLPNSHLSSQLQSLLQNASHSPSNGMLQTSGRAVGGASLPSNDAAALGGSGNGLWSGNGAGGLMPGWLQSSPLKTDDQNSTDGSQNRDHPGGKTPKKEMGMVSGGGAADRGGKAKKRGGTNSRGKGDPKSSQHSK